MMLSVCIPSVVGREKDFESIKSEIKRQIIECDAIDKVELITDVDNKEVSIGYKRTRMYHRCSGEYAVQIDDDDWVSDQYIRLVLDAAEKGSDCIGYMEHCIIDGKTYLSMFSRRFRYWETRRTPDGQGFTFYRTPFTKTPIRTELCKELGVPDKRFGEDEQFAKRIYPHLRSETFIPEIMYYYTANTLTREEHNNRYGIKA